MNYTPEIKRILTPVPIDAECNAVLQKAMEFHKVYRSEIVILHIITETSFFQKVVPSYQLKDQFKRAKRKLQKLAEDFFNGSIPDFVSIQVKSGNLIKEIQNTADKSNCDLIIVNKEDRKNASFSFLKPENIEKLISSSSCPILTIPKNFAKPGIKNILIPVDITKKSTTKIAWVKYLAKKFKAKIHVVSVLNINIPTIDSLAYKKAKEIEEIVKKEGLDVDITLLETKQQSMYDVILSHIHNLKPDLVLMMSHQENILFDNYIGKFAREVIHNSPSPVFNLTPTQETLIGDFLNSLGTNNAIKINSIS